jgi:hypothetical protein
MRGYQTFRQARIRLFWVEVITITKFNDSHHVRVVCYELSISQMAMNVRPFEGYDRLKVMTIGRLLQKLSVCTKFDWCFVLPTLLYT